MNDKKQQQSEQDEHHHSEEFFDKIRASFMKHDILTIDFGREYTENKKLYNEQSEIYHMKCPQRYICMKVCT